MSEQTKTCPDCNETKDVGCFSKAKNRPDGCYYRCKACVKAYNQINKDKEIARRKAYRESNKEKIAIIKKAHREANRDKVNAYHKAHSQSQRGRYNSYKSGAKRRSLPFELSFDEFMIFWQANCHYCGDQIATIGIDRIDSNVGYSLENCVPCCARCNYVKLDYDIEETNMHILKMLKHQGIV